MSLPSSIHAAREMFRVKTSRNEFVTLVHEATNEDPWGPTGTQMEDVCRVFPRGSYDIMEEIRLRLKHREKSWRSCYKSLLLLDYLARNVTESLLPEICSVLPTLRTISQTFYYTGKKGVDHGLSVRERAKKLTDMLSDAVQLRAEREKAAVTHSKLTAESSQSGAGGGGSGAYRNYSLHYGEGGGAQAVASSSYDPYVPRRSPATRAREEQERYDMELAARMQREEEARSGVTAAEVERQFHQQAQTASKRSQSTFDADMELARRLQEEEEAQSHRAGVARSPPSAPVAQKTEEPRIDPPKIEPPKVEPPKTEPAKPATDMLDDLFAPVPLPAPAAAGQPGWTTASTAPSAQAQQSSSADPFDAFLNTCMHQQQQFQTPPMQQGQPALTGTAQPQLPAGGGGGGDTWFGGTSQTQPVMMPNQQNQLGGFPGGMPPAQFNAAPQPNQWGTTAPSSNYSSSNVVMQQTHLTPQQQQQNAVYQNSGAYGGFMGANMGGASSGTGIGQQFTNTFGGGSQNNKSLDALMSERRATQ